jgi:glutamate racemase
LKTVGVFDSGVGGLSVLRTLLEEIPQARFVYVADSAYAPYGARPSGDIIGRTRHITECLRRDHAIDALVVACNTATAHAVDTLRAEHPDLPIVGVEPALKPAATLSRSGHVGVLATRGTVHSERFARLRAGLQTGTGRPVHFSVQACEGLADAIERFDTARVQALCEQHVFALRAQAPHLAPIDTLVLGCTHYPFAADVLAALCGPDVTLIETGLPVALRARSVLGLAAPTYSMAAPALLLLSSGPGNALAEAARRWLGRDEPVHSLIG